MTESKSAADHDKAPSGEDGAKPGADISFPYDRMTVEQSEDASPVPAGAMPARPGSFPGGRRPAASDDGLPRSSPKPTPMRTQRDATPSPSIPSTVHISNSARQASESARRIRRPSSTNCARCHSHGGTAISGFGTFPSGPMRNSGADGPRSRRRLAGTSRKRDDVEPRSGRGPNRRCAANSALRNESVTVTRFRATTCRQ